MLVLNPRVVSFDGVVWEDVSLVAVDRSAHRVVQEWSDMGAYAVFADVPEQAVSVKVVQQVARDDVGTPVPGQSGELVFVTGPAGGDTPRTRVKVQCVVERVGHEISLKNGAVRTVALIAVSGDGVSDPIVLEDASGIG